MLHFPTGLFVTLICASVMSPTAHAVDRCNTKFEFYNGTATTIQVVDRVRIRGNRGRYTEQLDRARELAPGQRVTTRRNRLQKVDDGTLAVFKIQFKRFYRDQTWTPSKKRSARQIGPWYAEDIEDPELMSIHRRMGLVVSERCVDGGTIRFAIRSLPNTAANRASLRRLLNLHRHPGSENDWYRIYIDLN
ncbi:MAG: hypothetical protein H6934_12190 [Burkholderiaceae bacterium]|nr:hypothetical protein [Burkholderiaceae bacterium]